MRLQGQLKHKNKNTKHFYNLIPIGVRSFYFLIPKLEIISKFVENNFQNNVKIGVISIQSFSTQNRGMAA